MTNDRQQMPAALRIAARTWSRRDRRASGEVVLATALDLIDAGGSVRREALDLVRTGAVLRVRGVGRDLRTAPWAEAARLATIGACLMVVALVAAHIGGLSAPVLLRSPSTDAVVVDPTTGVNTVFTDARAAHLLVVVAALTSALLIFLRRTYLAPIALVAGLGATLYAAGRGYGLGMAFMSYSIHATDGHWTGGPAEIGAAIDLTALIGLLTIGSLFGAMTLAVVARRSPAPRTTVSLRATLGFCAAAIMAAVVIPMGVDAAVAHLDATLGASGVAASHDAGGRTESDALMVFALGTVLALLTPLLAWRFIPRAALAGAILVTLLWIPATWASFQVAEYLQLPLLPPMRWVEWIGPLGIWLWWVLVGAVGLACSLGVGASLGRRDPARRIDYRQQA